MNIYLAPMEGVIDHHMRSILTTIGGLDFCVTEFVRVTDHTLPERVFHRYCPELTQGPHTTQTRVQLLGSNPIALANNAAKVAKMGAPGIDLNFGCPAKTVNKNKGGACLLDETGLIREIVSRVRDAVLPSIPVSAKIRLGYNARDSYLENAVAIADAGANELIVHARSKADGYNPPAYWTAIGEIRNTIGITVVANGEIWNIENFLQCKKESTCNDFMLGRGALAQPDLPLAIKAHANNRPYVQMKWEEIIPHIHTFFENTCSYYPKKYTGNRLKQWLHYLRLNYVEADILFDKIKRVRDEQTIRKEIELSATHNSK